MGLFSCLSHLIYPHTLHNTHTHVEREKKKRKKKMRELGEGSTGLSVRTALWSIRKDRE